MSSNPDSTTCQLQGLRQVTQAPPSGKGGHWKRLRSPAPLRAPRAQAPFTLQPQHPPPFQTLSGYSQNMCLVYTEGLQRSPVLKCSFDSKPNREENKQKGHISKIGNRIYLFQVNGNSISGAASFSLSRFGSGNPLVRSREEGQSPKLLTWTFQLALLK